MKKYLGFLFVIAVLIFAFLTWNQTENPEAANLAQKHITTNISALSPIKEQLGGTFFVTTIQAADGAGVVKYEDGHNAYTADFTYEADGSITSFTIRE